jgi:polysaccharide biosynthesis/export protein
VLRYPGVIALIVIGLHIAGCGNQNMSDGIAPTGELAISATMDTGSIPVARASGDTTIAVPGEDYRLSPLDMIEVSVFQIPDLTRTVQINTSGQIALPLIGTISAGGKTVRELELEISRLYGARYVQSPQVSVFVKEFISQQFTVEGAVNSPGVYKFSGKATLLQAIAMARGVDRTADSSGVMIFRTVNGQRQGAVFDIVSIRRGQKPDPVLAGGDMIVVDQSAALTAWRAVRESIGVLGFFRPVFL